MDPQAIILLVLVVLGSAFAVYQVPKWQVRRVEKLEDRLALETEARKTLAQILGGVFFIATLFFTWKNLAVTQETLRVSQEGQITERFTRAIEQLGDERLEVRLGGIYALERVAKDSPKDHWTIMEVLTAFVRENARWEDRPKKDKPKAKETNSDKEGKGFRLPADIQAILTVVGRRTQTLEREVQRIDLSGIDIRGANLGGANLQGANLGRANLEGAFLASVNLERVTLGRANLKKAQLGEANLEGAYLSKANLEGAWLQGANLGRAHLKEAQLGEANLKRADLRGATGLTKKQIKSAIIDEYTKLPDYLKEPGQAKPG